ncbi:hypothetical protein ACFLXC_03675 [Chloroflexota bacterium]
MCQKIPIDKSTQEYIANKAEHCTPAQLQEIIFSLVIHHSDGLLEPESTYLAVNKEDIDSAISKINGKSRQQIGFTIQGNHSGQKLEMLQ